MPGGRNDRETCLGVRPRTRGPVADEASRAVAASIAAALDDRRAPYKRDCFWKSLGLGR